MGQEYVRIIAENVISVAEPFETGSLSTSSTTLQMLPTKSCKSILIRSDKNNSIDLEIRNTTGYGGTPFPLSPGDAVSLTVPNVDDVSFRSTVAGTSVTIFWITEH